MDKTVVGEENIYFEMESKEATGAGIYDTSESAAHATKQTTFQKQESEKIRQAPTQPAHSTQSDAVIVQRLLYIIAAVVIVSFLTAAATLIVALTMMMSRNASTDCSALKGSDTSTPSADYTELTNNVRDLKRNVSSFKNTSEHYLKKIKDLESLLNSTRQDAKEVSRQHLAALWLAGNFTKKELHKVWIGVNASQIGLEEELIKLKHNLTQQVNDVSKMAGPIGPPGSNGSQGPAGPAGSVGPFGPKGAGDFSTCQHKVVAVTLTPGTIDVTAGLAEPNGKRILGVSCSTNYAAEYNLLSIVLNNVRRYSCLCKGTSALFQPTWGQQKSCYLHYWECPLTT